MAYIIEIERYRMKIRGAGHLVEVSLGGTTISAGKSWLGSYLPRRRPDHRPAAARARRGTLVPAGSQ
jgi:hypothetical protein